ncbi:MAG: endoglucanase-related protein glucosyl hydrolase family 9 protein, partial [Actinomycetota bacterium]
LALPTLRGVSSVSGSTSTLKAHGTPNPAATKTKISLYRSSTISDANLVASFDVTDGNDVTFTGLSAGTTYYVVYSSLAATNDIYYTSQIGSPTAIATYGVTTSPTITTQPVASTSKIVGDSLRLAVIVDPAGMTAISYQWKKNGVSIAGATSDSLDIASVLVSDAATYTVDVFNKANGIMSAATTTSDAVVTVAKATPTLGTLSATTKTFGDAAFNITPTSASPSGGSWSYDASDLTVATTTGSTVTILKAGSTTITATYIPSDQTNYNNATATFVLTVNRASRTVSVTNTTQVYGTNFTLNATASAGTGTISYAYVSGPCTLSGANNATATPTAVGACVVTASIAQDADYVSVGSGNSTITITAASRSLTFATTSYSKTYGDSFTVTATTDAGDGPISYDVTDSTACSVGVATGVVTITSGVGTCHISATIAASGNYTSVATLTPVTVTVAKANVTIAQPSAITKTYLEASFDVTDPTSSVAGTWVYSSNNTAVATVSGTRVSITGAGSATITAAFTPSSSNNYNTGSTTIALTVDKAAQAALSATASPSSYVSDGTKFSTNISISATGGSSHQTPVQSPRTLRQPPSPVRVQALV